VQNFLCILRSSSPCRVQRHQCYTNCWGRSCCKKATVPYLSIHHLHFRGGQKSAAPTSVNLGPHHISETIRARKLKFYAHLHGSSTLLEYENFSARGPGVTVPPSVNLEPPHISETIRDRKLKFYTHLDMVKHSFRG